MHNFSDVVSAFADLPTVIGALLVDGDGLALASSLGDKSKSEALSPVVHALLNDAFKRLSEMGETANQIIFVQDSRIIIAQPVHDVILVVYSEKTGLDLLQSRFSNAVSILKRITEPDFSNT
ncbi:MAG: roadblock/LC7 domain-containing protein [Chloroherpetonaceae bacterium]|nr:roadblock/LC7 domain-containing protein [Chloroherpetonaceae bacterium]MDW8438251.1 roadblock/LC7 domain-containing protein [Chloroherpetonaceae bacterium]